MRWGAIFGTLVTLWCCCALVHGKAFNFEIARRTIDNIHNFLDQVDFPLNQVVEYFGVGILPTNVTANSTEFFVGTRRLLLTQLIAVPQIAACYVYVHDQLIGISRDGNFVYSTQHVPGVDCDENTVTATFTNTNRTECLHVSTIGNNGEEDMVLGSLRTDAMFALAPPNDTVASWTPVIPVSLVALGIAKTTALRDVNGNVVGFVAVAIALPQLSDLLATAFGNKQDSRVVYIAEIETDFLVAESVGEMTGYTPFGTLERITAENSSNSQIRESFEFLHSLAHSEDAELIYIHNGFYVQSSFVFLPGISWHVVVVRPADISQDFISTSSVAFFVVCILASLVIVISLINIGWVIRFRNLHLWKAAQPPVLVSILTSNIIGASCTFALSGSPSKLHCLARQWMVVLCITLTCGSFLGKLLRVSTAMGHKFVIYKDLAKAMTAARVAYFVFAVVLIQVMLLSVWTALDPMRPQLRYTFRLGVAVGQEVCASSSSWGMVSSGVFVGLLVLGGCYMSYETRFVSETFAESRAVMMTFYHGAFILFVLVPVGVFAHVSTKSFLMCIILALLWFSITTQTALVLPRVYRQLTLGDFSMWEMKEMARRHLTKQNIFSEARENAARVSFGISITQSKPSFTRKTDLAAINDDTVVESVTFVI